MKIIHKKVTVKLDKEERERLIATIDLLSDMEKTIRCDNDCPFKEQCDQESNINCLLGTVKTGLLYINNNCD